ncbi:MAG: bifunctional 4-hydroxy-3-methylbut-2-enyl diphosphate reductase/30S ribosomal protein S1 [Firmicutes bacterium]|nr:bifunctional 4-hydroxy-3-methylbut-2-enyl diphosphate reductase/30S ribosomal protein S1 [Bacillota bacterium]
MQIMVANHLGFCAGVASAVNTAYKMAELMEKTEKTEKSQKYVTLGPIIHNSLVTDDLAQKGVKIIEDVSEVPKNTQVIIRAHGVPPAVEQLLVEKNIPYIDRTCPHVKIIHKKVEECTKMNRTLIILGKKGHPEVQGILGYATENVIIAENSSALQNIDNTKKYFLVVQTTHPQKDFETAKNFLQQKNFDVIIHNTICNATYRRQTEVERIAKLVNVMVILGDKNSANTKNLYEISRKYCPKTILAQNIKNITKQNLQYIFSCDTMGLTAGASTPPAVIKEALFVMSELEKKITAEQDIEKNANGSAVQESNDSNNQSFEEMLDEAFVTLKNGDTVKGTVIQVTNSEITVNLGYKSDGIITKTEFSNDPNVELPKMVTLGEEIEVLVVRVNDGDGNVMVSKRRLEARANYKLLEQAFANKEPLPGKVQDLVKGGLLVDVLGTRVFVPSSQISNRYVEDLSIYKGKQFNFNIIELEPAKRKIIGSRRELAVLEARAKKEEFLKTVAVGDKLTGKVNRIADFGAFVDLDGVDGLIHISELAWKRVRKVTEILNVGDTVDVTVLSLNPEKGKISLTLKDVKNNPWNTILERYPVGSLVEGKVVRTTNFGAFLNLEDGIDGLIHISQISEKHVEKPEDELAINQIITVKVTDVNLETRKISLSKKAADAELAEDELEEEVAN